MQLSDIDLLDRDRFTEGVPHEWFTYLRREAPVYHHPEPGGPGFWVITKHADVVAVGRDGATFSSDQKRGGVVQLEGRPEDYQFEQGGNLMLTMDAPEHTRYRKLVNRGFTPRQMRMIEPHIRDLANQIIDDVIEAGECDFVVDVAAELPLQVIAEMIGVPREDRHKLFEWSNRMIGSEDPEYRVSEEEVQNAQIEMFMYANELAQERRANPRDDIVTALLEAEVDGDQLSEMDFNLFFLLLAVAGQRDDPQLDLPRCPCVLRLPRPVPAPRRGSVAARSSAAEEVVRWASPVMYFRRNVTTDTELRGQALKAGEKVSIWYISANRDEDVFEEPFTFDITRNPNEHVGFGGGGPHHCLGSNLARMEIYVLLEEMARRIPKLELIGDVPPLRSNFIAGIKHMPVKFPKASREVARV